MEINEIIKEITEQGVLKAVLSKPKKTAEYKKINISCSDKGYMSEAFTEKQAFHKTLGGNELEGYLEDTAGEYMQLNAWTNGVEHIVLVSKKGHVTYKKKQSSECCLKPIAHNRKKQYLIEEGTIVPPLVDMGIFTSDGKIVRTMYDKFRQINRFIELINDEIKNRDYKSINIIDFGCGKSYLTFIVYYYLVEIMHIDAHITGLDLKEDVIRDCNRAARRYGYDGLKFEIGDINGYRCETKPDMVITLHACDTATDFALYNAVSWGAELIFSVPCCQHELNAQMKSDRLSILTRYGIIKERTAALMTDAIRGNLLQYMGYSTQLLEFVDLSHTPKNILIRAVKSNISQKAKDKALAEVEALIDEFGFEQTLYRLLTDTK
ncbi:MAG: class I SAM-dependent methyltransferase [Candidatus Ornithomonoglobus sp.]